MCFIIVNYEQRRKRALEKLKNQIFFLKSNFSRTPATQILSMTEYNLLKN